MCLPLSGSASDQKSLAARSSTDVLIVDGTEVTSEPYGRFLCTVDDLQPGKHVVTRLTQ